MSQRELNMRRQRRISLSLRVSMLLMFAAILPLIITVAISEYFSRPQLVDQANTAMQSDAQRSTQLINTYFTERLLDVATLSQVPTVQAFLAKEKPTPDDTLHASYSLVAGSIRDKRYTTWVLFDTHGKLRLYYPTVPQAHGQYLVPPAYLQAVTTGKSFISAVYYDPKTQKASVDIYHPIMLGQTHTMLGFIRSTLKLDYIWDIVQKDQGANGNGSYAFILDQNGVRIADTDASRLFSAVAPLSTQTQLLINSEARYGTEQKVPVLADPTLAAFQQNSQPDNLFQMTPANQSETFQAVRQPTAIVPWSYFVLSPVSTVTSVANSQILITSVIALVVLLLAAIVGVVVGRRITRPILGSVEYLRGSSEALNALATKQQNGAKEQMWVVDSSQVGLQSVQYYTDASRVAAHQLSEMSGELAQHWYQIDPQTAKGILEQMSQTAQYIENATHYQDTSNQKLATAIKVTSQVTEQLATGATSAGDAANQLERVVNQLRNVVGK